MKFSSQFVALLLLGIVACSYNVEPSTGLTKRVLSLTETSNNAEALCGNCGNSAWPEISRYFIVTNFNNEQLILTADIKNLSLSMKVHNLDKVSKQYEQHFFAEYMEHEKAYVIRTRMKRNLVWTAGEKISTNAFKVQNFEMKLEEYVVGNKKQLWRKTQPASSFGHHFSPVYIFNVADATQTPGCFPSKGFKHASANVLDYDQCHQPFPKVYNTMYKKTKKQRWLIHELPHCKVTSECCPDGSAPPCENMKDIVEIYTLQAKIVDGKMVGAEKTSVMFGGEHPVETVSTTTVKMDEGNRKQWWWREPLDHDGIVFHLFDSPDMVLSYLKETPTKEIDPKKKEKDSSGDEFRYLALEKYIPGDKRQLWIENQEQKKLLTVGEFEEAQVKGSKNQVMSSNNSDNKEDKEKYPVVVMEEKSDMRINQSYQVKEVDFRSKIPQNSDLAISVQIKGTRSKGIDDRQVLTWNEDTNKEDDSHFKFQIWSKATKNNQLYYAIEINSGWVLFSTGHKNKAITYSKEKIVLKDYLAGNPSQIWIAGAKGQVCLRDPFYNQTGYSNKCMKATSTGVEFADEPAGDASDAKMELEWLHHEYHSKFPTTYHFVPRNRKNDKMNINANISTCKSSASSTKICALQSMEYKIEELKTDQYFAVANTNDENLFSIHNVSNPDLLWEVQEHLPNERKGLPIQFTNKKDVKNKDLTFFAYTKEGEITYTDKDKTVYYVQLDKINTFAERETIYAEKNTQSGAERKWDLRRTGSLRAQERNINCPMCGVYALESWREDTFKKGAHDYPYTFLRISEPEVQIVINWDRSFKWCNDKGEAKTTNPCEEYYHFTDFSANRVEVKQEKVRYVTTHADYIVPSWTIFSEQDKDHIRQAYAWDEETFRTPNVGVIWKRVTDADWSAYG